MINWEGILVLMKLLKIIANKGFYSKNAIAKEMGVAEGFLEEMVEQLFRMGYIEKVREQGCVGGCKGCAKASCCSSSNANVVFIRITEKGKVRL